ncbi:MAG: RNA 3'-phosphate cyclase [Nitrosopumilus sp.]|nr:RNA 3'-phosphate cyclase [Nitrosopumilus sp.]NNL36796.1 RNA 3'-phosphate cyclase [Nitrosopumilus sp.]
MDYLKINGAHGEGGGQIVRSAITLSCITKKPIHLENIRKNRKVPGLRPQHITAITILQKIANARVFGAEIGSTELKFIPGKIESLNVVEDVGTAGSIPLILQVLIPVSSISQKQLNLTIKGGTDVLWSPTIDYTQYVLKEAYSRMGIEFTLEVDRRGYYPKGNGKVKLQICKSNLKSISFSKRKTKNVKLICSFSKLSKEKIKNEINRIVKKITEQNFIVDTIIKDEEALDSGATLLIYTIDDGSIIGIDALYNNKIQSFDLDIENFIQSFSIDDNLADMLIVPASLSLGKTILPVKEITKHLETNLYVTSKITGCKYGIGKTNYGFEVIIEGISNSCI